MPVTWAQTGMRHSDINIQREFERKSSPVKTEDSKNSVTSNGTTSSQGSPKGLSDAKYSIYHNGTVINTIGMNQSINFTDIEPYSDTMKQVVFTLRAIGDNGKEDVILAAFTPTEPWYIERFTLDVIDTTAAQDLILGGYKYRQPMYHDVLHNIDNPVYSIYSVGNEYAIPEVELIGKTFRVRDRISNAYSNAKPFLNTHWHFNSDINENIGKFDVVEFIIIVKGAS